ncbi:SIR2 family protein [Parabacteroides sp. FAFU027]|uniref:SIR2 family protein n=1 Tax=Parabacteroides sp. FAFU027 TaxID=2922715 RepID=UPI001FAFA241|nr:SIR2 family protein [Parabacteroides sp. FAFU027]
MKFLEKVYIKELNSPDSDRVSIKDTKLSDGTKQLMISIDGNDFLPSSILFDDETSYSQSFELWMQERKDILKDKANQILALYDNIERFNKLSKSLKANSIIPFLGAGISIPSNYASWTSFLYKLRYESEITEEDLNSLLIHGKYEEAAQILYEDLGDALFNEHLENEYSAEREICGSINYLPILFPDSSIITTNFDNNIERIYNDLGQGFNYIKSGKYLDETIRQMSSGSKFLIKLHGDCIQIADRVLTKIEYDMAYLNGDVLERFINRLLIKGSLLFVGCSLTNDRTIHTIKKIVKKEGAGSLPRNYAFLEEIKDNKMRSKRKRELASANIFPIWYPEGQHDESIEALFLKLLEERQ